MMSLQEKIDELIALYSENVNNNLTMNDLIVELAQARNSTSATKGIWSEKDIQALRKELENK